MLNVEANNLLNGSGLHSFEEEMNAINSKMNYKGAAFAKFNDYDPELSRQLGEYDHKMQFSNNPREVVYAYFDNRDLYLENTEEKRSLFSTVIIPSKPKLFLWNPIIFDFSSSVKSSIFPFTKR